jgi:signal transduction histidine kinase
MNATSPSSNEAELKFFGKLTASMTHDVKNALATINENAGLLTDFTAMAARGTPLDPERVRQLAQRIMDQVKRADGLLKSMNRFAHSVDDYQKTVDVNDILHLLAALSLRFASMRSVSLQVRPAAGPVEISTAPFLLLNALFDCLEVAMQAAGRGQCLTLNAEKTDTGVRIQFGPLKELDRMPSAALPQIASSRLPASVAVRIDTEAEALNLFVSYR